MANDPNKLREFTEGADGHALRSISSFSKLTTPITIKGTYIDPEIVRQYTTDDVKSINKYKADHKDMRDAIKQLSFALQYRGTAFTLHKNSKIPLDVAEVIEEGYKELYKATVEFSDKVIAKAKKDGYVIGAFGLKLRTPGFKSSENSIVEAEGRTANNMVTQSYGMLTNRACITLQDALERDGMVEQVVITNQIHDAIYGLCRATPEAVKWVNDNLIGAMVPDFVDNQPIHLEAEVDFGYSWKDQNTVPNAMSIEGCAEFIEALQIVDQDTRKDRLKEIYKTYST